MPVLDGTHRHDTLSRLLRKIELIDDHVNAGIGIEIPNRELIIPLISLIPPWERASVEQMILDIPIRLETTEIEMTFFCRLYLAKRAYLLLSRSERGQDMSVMVLGNPRGTIMVV